jgi:hypothetical protein
VSVVAIVMQLIGTAIAYAFIRFLYPPALSVADGAGPPPT